MLFGPVRDASAVMLDLIDQAAFEGDRRTVANLAELESPSGQSYHELAGRTRRTPFFGEIKYASTDYEVIPGTREEVAYWCHLEELWVQGTPGGQAYNNLGPLSGSAGLNLVCRSCGRKIGQSVMMRS
jgi:hypothetical protein